MTRTLIIMLLSLCAGLKCQVTEFSNYTWTTFPSLPEQDSVKAVNGCVITLERRITEVYANKEEVFEEISIFHRKIRVESHDAINSFNKIYIPVGNVIEILDVKARFISPGGKITELPKESIRQVENLENRGDYQTFAIEGAEVGGEIEYYYTLRRRYDPNGTIVLQGEEPRTNVEVIFVIPSKLEYFIKSYNGFPEFSVISDSASGKTYMKANKPHIPSLPEERYAVYEANLMRYEYTLAYNFYTGSLRVYSFSKICSNIYSNIYVLSKSEKSAVIGLIKNFNLRDLSTLQKIRKIEDWVKSEISVSEELQATPPVDEMIRLRQTTKLGAARLMVALLNQAGIEFELVATCDQTVRKFDPDFNGWNFLDDYIIFFPGLYQVIVPENPMYRIGLIPSNYQGSFGLFMHPIGYGEDLKTLAYEVKQLPEERYQQNADTMHIRLKVDLERMDLQANVRRIFTGELASSYQSFWKFADEARHDQIVSALFNMGNENTTISSYTLLHDSPADIVNLPLIWNVDLTAHALVEQAGQDIIIKIGETIGEQSELYQTTTRRLPIYVNSIHNYFRKIEFEIPEGYALSDPKNLNMKIEMLNNGKVSSCFISNYELQGNKLIIYSTEFYAEMEYPASRFEEFRKVINAAADFNKKTIILTRTGGST